MNITIINGIKDTKTNPMQMQLELASVKISSQHNVDLFTIDDMDINYCCGCFNCWVKTPGVCVFKDDMKDIYKSIVKTDLLLFVSPIDAGFITSEAKRAMDRIIPVLQPFIKIYGGESHHVPRYEKRSKLGVLIIDEGNLDSEAVDVVYNCIQRLSKNYHAISTICACADAGNLLEVMQNEISNC